MSNGIIFISLASEFRSGMISICAASNLLRATDQQPAPARAGSSGRIPTPRATRRGCWYRARRTTAKLDDMKLVKLEVAPADTGDSRAEGRRLAAIWSTALS